MPIPAKFKGAVEPFLHKELEVDVKIGDEGQLLVIKAQKIPEEIF